MRRGALLLLLAAGPALTPAHAQVQVNPGALDALRPTAPAVKPDAAAPRKAAPPASKTSSTKPAPKPTAKPGAPPPAKPPHVPLSPPPEAVVPPPIVVPLQRPPPPTPVPVQADAPGEATKIPGGVRVTFGAGRADLNAATEAAVRSIGRALHADESVNVNLYAFAAGPPDDPSTPRRLALSRALAVRAALIAEGVASTRIYPRALGGAAPPAGMEGPPDRVDVVQVLPSGASRPEAAKP